MAAQKINCGAGKVVAVVVTHRRLDQLQTTLARLLAEPQTLLAGIVVVDNASGDGTADWLQSLHDPRLRVLPQQKNLGGAGGFELGLRQAITDHDPDWFLLMDDDARPFPGALTAFHAANPDRWSAVAAAVYSPDGQICEMNRPSFNPFSRADVFWRTARNGRDGFHLPHAAYEGNEVQVDVASFVGLFLSRPTLQRVGLPQGRLFLYADDGLYTLGLTNAGGHIGFLPQIRFEHDCTTRSDGGTGRFSPLWKVYYYHRNLLLLYRMASGVWFFLVLAIVLPKWIAKIRHHKGDRGVFLCLLMRAIFDGLLGRLSQDHARLLASVDRWLARD